MSQIAKLTTAVEHALSAPSVHNTRPWRWRIRGDTVELHADWTRNLIATDPDRRDLVLSCGAALPHPPEHGLVDDAAVLLVIATPGDGPLDRLRAGEATSAVLLAATRLGLATTPLSQAVEVDATRRAIQQKVLHVPEHPQLIIRVGWPATGAAELPVSQRRDLRSIVLP